MFALPPPGHAQEIKLVTTGSLTDAFKAMISEHAESRPVRIDTTWPS